MKRSIATVALGALAVSLQTGALPAQTPAAATFAYHSTTQAPSGPVSVNCTVTVAPASPGNVAVTLALPGKPPITLTLPAGGSGAMPAPQGTPNPERAQAQLILERVAILGQIRKSKTQGSALKVKIPVLAPGATAPLQLPATLAPAATAAGATLTGTASTQTSATVDTQKAKIHGLLPVRRLAERARNAVTPKTVTLPDYVNASVTATLSGTTLTELSGTVNQALSGNGKSIAIPESWTLTKT
jgi:hypothetical protein